MCLAKLMYNIYRKKKIVTFSNLEFKLFKVGN